MTPHLFILRTGERDYIDMFCDAIPWSDRLVLLWNREGEKRLVPRFVVDEAWAFYQDGLRLVSCGILDLPLPVVFGRITWDQALPISAPTEVRHVAH